MRSAKPGTRHLRQQPSTGVPSAWSRTARISLSFPDDPTTGAWGRGSRLAFRTAVALHKRVFVVTTIPPLANRYTRVSQASLFGVVQGYLVEPVAAELIHAA